MIRTLSVSLLLVAQVAAFGCDGAAATLGGRECVGLAREKQKLVVMGVRSHLDRGADWAKANLTLEKINRVKRLIALTETIEFQCDAAEMRKARARMTSGKYRKWEALNPPLPARNPKRVAAGTAIVPAAKPAQAPVKQPVRTVNPVRTVK